MIQVSLNSGLFFTGLLTLFSNPSDAYFTGPDMVNWGAAQAYCASQGSNLATIQTLEENEKAQSACDSESCWIGLHIANGNGFTWTWDDGVANFGSYPKLGFNDIWGRYPNTGVFPWSVAQPDNGGVQEYCVFMGYGESKLWGDYNCDGGSAKPLCDGYRENAREVLAKTNACFSARQYTNDYSFNAPENGNILGIKLVHKSGGVSCHSAIPLTNWGCDETQFFVQMVREGNDHQSIYPTQNSDGITSFTHWTGECPSQLCTVGRYEMDSFTTNSNELVLMDSESAVPVTRDQTFSLQYSEGCCNAAAGDNSGQTCADVYFLYEAKTEILPPIGCVALRSIFWDKYVVVESDGLVYANGEDIGVWERFILTRDVLHGTYSLYSPYWGKTLQVQTSLGLLAVDLNGDVSATERFEIESCDGMRNDCFSLVSEAYQRYMVAENIVNVNREGLGAWEEFEIIPTNGC